MSVCTLIFIDIGYRMSNLPNTAAITISCAFTALIRSSEDPVSACTVSTACLVICSTLFCVCTVAALSSNT